MRSRRRSERYREVAAAAPAVVTAEPRRPLGTAPISIAFVAGGLATLNPCGFPLLPAFLSFYAGADEARLPRAPSRVLQGLFVGLLVTVDGRRHRAVPSWGEVLANMQGLIL